VTNSSGIVHNIVTSTKIYLQAKTGLTNSMRYMHILRN